MFFENSHRHLYFVEVLVVLSYVIRKGSDTIKYCAQYNYVVFRRWDCCVQNVKKSNYFLNSTFYATIAWMENGVS